MVFAAGEVAGHTLPHAQISVIRRFREPPANATHALRAALDSFQRHITERTPACARDGR